MRSYDMVVVGSGPAGQKAAIQAAKLSKRVALIEKAAPLGGASVNTGTLPSKTLKDTIDYLQGLARRGFPHLGADLVRRISFPDLMARKDQVIRTEVAVVTDQLQRNHVEIIQSTAAFADPHTLHVTCRDGRIEHVRAAAIILATGSRPRRPPDIPFDDVTLCDSDSFLTTTKAPASITVMGGGVVGAEYASMLGAFGIRVTLIDRRTQLLRFVDRDLMAVLDSHMRRNGVTMRLGEEIAEVTLDPQGGVLTRLRQGEPIVTDMLLYAMGRVGNTELLNLDTIGLPVEQGLLTVNDRYQTAIPHIYAVGDVIGFPALAATSMEQGRLAACHACGVPQPAAPTTIPYGIYTVPELSMVGKTEEELAAARVPYAVGRAFYREIARGHISGDLEGLFKLLFRRDTRELLGVHIIGPGATELIHIAQPVLAYHGTVDFFVHNVFNYPTLAECYRTAALDGLNRLSPTSSHRPSSPPTIAPAA